jgi:hypothetical protein
MRGPLNVKYEMYQVRFQLQAVTLQWFILSYKSGNSVCSKFCAFRLQIDIFWRDNVFGVDEIG